MMMNNAWPSLSCINMSNNAYICIIGINNIGNDCVHIIVAVLHNRLK